MFDGVGSPRLLFKLVNLKPIRPILWVGLHLDGASRPVVYDPEWDLRALMLRMLLQLRYVKDLVRFLRRSAYFRRHADIRIGFSLKPISAR